MFIQTEPTPNPLTLKFLPGRVVMKEGTLFLKDISDAENIPFAKKLFGIDGVDGVFFGNDFITITKLEKVDWDTLKPQLLGSISEFFDSGEEINLTPQDNEKQNISEEDSSNIVKQIKELLDTRVRPAVAMDGGDIVYDSFKEGVVYLHMQGSCAGCPSSTATLKSGIENMLKHYIPEVKEVRETNA